MPDPRPALLFHCQHSLGLGHLVRSFALAEALAGRFRVTFLCGGELPGALAVPPGVELVPLPALEVSAAGRLASRVPGLTVENAVALRRERVLAAFRSVRPAAVVVELFPFGRKKLAGELLPLLQEAAAARRPRPVVVCSLRDILVGRDDQGRHDERASRIANRYLDAVLVHADPRFARLEETFRPRSPLRVPVHHTGFVARRRPARDDAGAGRTRIVVSAGGGRFGGPLFRAAVDANARLTEPMTIVAGPFLPEGEWTALRAAVDRTDRIELRRSVPDLGDELARAKASVSQCGYNTALDLLRARVPALVVPFAAPGEDEQTARAARLAALGAVRTLDPASLDGRSLAAALRGLLDFRPAPVDLDLDGAASGARVVHELVRSRALRGAA